MDSSAKPTKHATKKKAGSRYPFPRSHARRAFAAMQLARPWEFP